MGWLGNIINRGARLRGVECGSTLPENPTLADLRAEAYQIAQMAKEVQNTEKPWSDEHWQKISQAIETLETRPLNAEERGTP